MIRSLLLAVGLASVTYGQSGNVVMFGDIDAPEAYRTPPANVQMAKISAAARHCMGIDVQGQLHIWGWPLNSCFDSAYGATGEFSMVSAGGLNHAVAIRDTSGPNLVCWGNSNCGFSCPASAPTLKQIDSGNFFIAGITEEDTFYCSGSNDDGQCDVPNLPEGRFPIQLSCGLSHVIALLDNGSLMCWGNDFYGQCQSPSGTFSYVAAGAQFSMAIKQDGTLVCWGRNDEGQCNSPADLLFVKADGGSNFGVGITKTGEVVAWGNNNADGQLNVPPGLVGASHVACNERATVVISDADSDGDGVTDYWDGCPNDPSKIEPGICGCGNTDVDSDQDGVFDCDDGCPNDPNKSSPEPCGCSAPDSDGDGTEDCVDLCPNDPNKINPGFCGCGNPETDSDGDGVPDCLDGCPNDASKTEPQVCGCGTQETNVNGDIDCDGDYDIDDVRLGMSSFGIEEATENDCPEDLDQDETIGFADLLQLLSAWGPCSG